MTMSRNEEMREFLGEVVNKAEYPYFSIPEMNGCFYINRGEHNSLMLANQIVAEAKSRFPVSVCVKGLLTEEEREQIEAECRITVPSVYMDGSCTYYIRWHGYRNRG